MEYDIEEILYNFEDDYNPGPRPMAQEPRNMYSGGQLVSPSVDGSRPGYSGKDLITFKELVKLDLPYSSATLSNVFSSPDRNKNLKKIFKDNGFKVVSRGSVEGKTGTQLLFNRPSASQIDNLWQDTIKLVESGKATIPDKMRIPFKNEVLKVFNEFKKTNTPFTTSDIYYKVVENVGDNKRIFLPKKRKEGTRVPGEQIKAALGKENSEFLLDGNIARIEKTTTNRKKMFDLLLKGETDVTSLAKDLGISKKDVYAEANKLFDESYRYTANMVRKTGAGSKYGYLKDYNQSDFNTVLKNLRKSGFERLDERSARALIYNAYGDKNSVNYSKKKFDLALKKLKEYNTINAELRNTFGKGFQLDHTLSFKALKDLGNTTPENLIRLNPLPENINKMKIAFDRSYNNIITQLRDGNISPNISKNLLEKKKLIEDISTKTNIGSFKVDSSGRKILSFGADPFLKTDIPSQMLKNVDVQNRLVDVLKDYSDEDLKKITKKQSFESLRNLEKIPKKEINLIKKDLSQLINDIGPCGSGKKKAMGGRIGLQKAGDVCMTGGRQTIAEFLKNGFKNANGEQKEIFKKILSLGGGAIKGVGSMLDPRELFKIKNLVGPAAWAAMGAFETGAITYEVVNNNIPLNEVLGSNWITKFAMPYNLKEAQIKNLEDSKGFSVSPAAKEYMAQTKLMANFEREFKALEGMKMGVFGTETPKELIQDQEKKLENIVKDVVKLQASPVAGNAGKLDFDKAFGEMAEKRGAGKYDPENEDANEYGYVDVGDSIFGFKKGTPLTYKYKKDRGKDQGRNFSETEREAEKLFPFETGTLRADYTPFNYKSFNYTPQELPADMVKQYEKDYNLPPRTSLNQFNFKGSDNNVLQDLTNEYNMTQRANQASKYPGYYGTQSPYSEGGIASLNVNKK